MDQIAKQEPVFELTLAELDLVGGREFESTGG